MSSNVIYYAYPIDKPVSFRYIAEQHIEYIKQLSNVNIQILNVETLEPTLLGFGRNIVLHPLFYPFLYTHPRPQVLQMLKSKGCKIIAFDTADSDSISQQAVSLANLAECVVVPSNFAKQVFNKCGVKNVEVIPHAIPKEFTTPERDITHPDLIKLAKIKEKKGFIFVHFNLSHSGYRKGADLFAKAMQIVQKENPNIVILLKRLEDIDPYVLLIRKLRTIEVGGYLSYDELRQLYDLSDIMVLTSRGGGFELNTLEAIARGVPTIVPKTGCFLDYIGYTIPVDVTEKRPIVLPDNPIHTGRGWEINVEKLAETILHTVDNIDVYKKRFRRYSKKVRKEYNYYSITKQILNLLDRYYFIH